MSGSRSKFTSCDDVRTQRSLLCQTERSNRRLPLCIGSPLGVLAHRAHQLRCPADQHLDGRITAIRRPRQWWQIRRCRIRPGLWQGKGWCARDEAAYQRPQPDGNADFWQHQRIHLAWQQHGKAIIIQKPCEACADAGCCQHHCDASTWQEATAHAHGWLDNILIDQQTTDERRCEDMEAEDGNHGRRYRQIEQHPWPCTVIVEWHLAGQRASRRGDEKAV